VEGQPSFRLGFIRTWRLGCTSFGALRDRGESQGRKRGVDLRHSSPEGNPVSGD
jgi:hypothetical protein